MSFQLELARAVTQLLTGRLLSQSQIQGISETLVGQLLRDWLPQAEEDKRVQARVDQAQQHISEASRIVTELKGELDQQVGQLEVLAKELEAKRAKAEEYATLVKADEPTVRAMRSQMEEAVRRELEQQSMRGRRLRQVIAALGWILTLLIGSAVGSHWGDIESAARGALQRASNTSNTAVQPTPQSGAADRSR